MVESGKGYPYVSVFIWPIRKKFQREIGNIKTLDNKHDCLGYICVDSLARGTFKERYDFDLGAAYSDILYVILKSLKIRENNNIILKKGEQNHE